MNILITGGCGFLGHHCVEHLLKDTDWNIYVFDRLSYAARGFDRLHDINAFDDARVAIFTCDITQPISEGILKETYDVDVILHLAAETHVDNSIVDPMKFVMANVVGTANMLDYARKVYSLDTFIYFSTDEVFGPAPKGVRYKEWDRYNCTNPYAATKAGAEQLVLAYMNTYALPGFIVHCMNVFGERQHPEKYIPMCISKILAGEVVTVHGSKTGLPGSRFYIHARNVANAITFLIRNYQQRQIYNIVGEWEVDNLGLAQTIALIVGEKLTYDMVDFHSSRPGHDLRYALDGTRMKERGWTIPVGFDESLRRTVEWTLENRRWLDRG